MCKAVMSPTRTEYDAVQTLLAFIAGYEFSYEEVKESDLLSTHYKYAYLLTHWGGAALDAFIDKLDQETRYSLILLNKIFAKFGS